MNLAHSPFIDVAKLCGAFGQIRLALSCSHDSIASPEPSKPLRSLLPLFRRGEIIIDFHYALLLRTISLAGKSGDLLLQPWRDEAMALINN